MNIVQINLSQIKAILQSPQIKSNLFRISNQIKSSLQLLTIQIKSHPSFSPYTIESTQIKTQFFTMTNYIKSDKIFGMTKSNQTQPIQGYL